MICCRGEVFSTFKINHVTGNGILFAVRIYVWNMDGKHG